MGAEVVLGVGEGVVGVKKPAFYTGSALSYLSQSFHAQKIAESYERFAREIGCTVRGDEIVATAKQAEKLDAKWRELNG